MPGHKRGPWSQQEDQLLIHLVSIHGAHNWVRISTSIQTRSPKQCRERYHQNLKPNLNHDPITAEEGVMIEQMVAEMGKRWAEIARRLRGRSDNAVKNWWNGGLNRRRRSNHQRRQEFEVRQAQNHPQQMQAIPQPMPQQPLPPVFHQQHMMPQHFYPQVMYPSQGYPYEPQHINVHANMTAFGRMIETPLPSPSAFSQMSAEGPPSLVSDSSSTSGRSDHHGSCPIELPPLAGAREERRRSTAPLLRLGVPGTFVQDTDFASMSSMQMQAFDMRKQGAVLQEPFEMQHHSFPTPSAYLPSQPRQPSPLHQQHLMPQGYGMPMHPTQRGYVGYPMPPAQMPSTPAQMQLPSILKTDTNAKPHITVDSGLVTPIMSGPTPDDSPRDKMSLSNLTH